MTANPAPLPADSDGLDALMRHYRADVRNGFTDAELDLYITRAQAIIAEKERVARINSLLDLEQWIKLHDLDTAMILDGIEHMAISLLQSPDQRKLEHKDRIQQLKDAADGRGEQQ